MGTEARTQAGWKTGRCANVFIFTDEEQKKWAHDVSDVCDVIDTDCRAQNNNTKGDIFAALNDNTQGDIFTALNDSTQGHIFAALNDNTQGHIFEALNDSTHGRIFEALNDSTQGHIFLPNMLLASGDIKQKQKHIFATSNVNFYKTGYGLLGMVIFLQLEMTALMGMFFCNFKCQF